MRPAREGCGCRCSISRGMPQAYQGWGTGDRASTCAPSNRRRIGGADPWSARVPPDPLSRRRIKSFNHQAQGALLLSVGNQFQAGYVKVVAAVVRHERYIVSQCSGRDPGVGTLYPATACLRGHGHFRPHGAELTAVREKHELFEIQPQPFAPRCPPLGLDGPAIEFRQRHERNQESTTIEVRFVKCPDRMVLENERDDVGIDDHVDHAAGSALLWPRHSCSAARKSSMDSSLGQKSPCRTDMSVIGPFPCWAIISSKEGSASKL